MSYDGERGGGVDEEKAVGRGEGVRKRRRSKEEEKEKDLKRRRRGEVGVKKRS